MTDHRPPAASLGRSRPRYGRVVAASGALVTTTVSVLGGLGVIATGPSAAETGRPRASQVQAAPEAVPDPGSETLSGTAPEEQSVQPGTVLTYPWQPEDATLPDDSGQGRRVVFSESRQQVWLVGADEEVERTYLVSGSVYDNLDPGSFEVFSRSQDAVGVDDSGTMKYFVRFTVGDNAAIGFHDIPRQDDAPVQSLDELGTPLSHGCIRQRRQDAVALWEFAPLGTTVVVTA